MTWAEWIAALPARLGDTPKSVPSPDPCLPGDVPLIYTVDVVTGDVCKANVGPPYDLLLVELQPNVQVSLGDLHFARKEHAA